MSVDIELLALSIVPALSLVAVILAVLWIHQTDQRAPDKVSAWDYSNYDKLQAAWTHASLLDKNIAVVRDSQNTPRTISGDRTKENKK